VKGFPAPVIPAPGTIIILNGTSSSGKSTLLRELQSALSEPYLDAGLDRFLWMLPRRYLDATRWPEVFGQAVRAGPIGLRLVSGIHQGIASLSRAGGNVLADHVLVVPEWRAECRSLFRGLPSLFVGVLRPAEALIQRELARADRTLGQALAQLDYVHEDADYDITVDTSLLSPAQGAEAVVTYLAQNGPNYAFGSPREA